jgi:predicted nucleic acid-binding protein
MDDAFWDSSALVRLCVRQQETPAIRALYASRRIAVWWATPIEMRSAFARLVRMGQLTANEHVQAQVELEDVRGSWREIEPSPRLREHAERLVERFPLKGADAQQLAAALIWSIGRPQGRDFISGDNQLLEAARQLGFDAIQA